MRGAIAAGHTVTAEAGARVLEAGGNAVDACLAAAFASWVAESPLTGPGGGGFGLVYLARDASTRVYDFFASIPSERRGAMDEVVVDFADASTQRFHVGEASCAVPGAVPGLEAIHRVHATIPWRELVAPAAALARAGVELTPAQTFLHEILDSTLRRTPAGRAVYPPPRAGDTLRLPALAATLDRLADEGSSAMPDLLDGLLPRSDLEAYRVSVRRPVETSFLGRRFLSNPPPSSGGVLIAYGLSLLDRLGLGGPAGSAAAAARLVEVMREQQRARGCRLTRRLLAEATLKAAAARLTGTTHISVVDGEGNVAALSASSGSGSGVIAAGFQLNNMLGELDLIGGSTRPGARLTSMMAPSLVLEEGRPRLVLGSAGSIRLRGAILQVVANVAGHGLPVAEAIAAPRVHLEGAQVEVEAGGPADGLAALGHDVVRWSGLNLYFGGVSAVETGAGGSLAAAGDPRRGGHGIVVA